MQWGITLLDELKSKKTGKDALFMVMNDSKHSGKWDMLERVLKIEGRTFERYISKFFEIIAIKSYSLLVTAVGEDTPMRSICNEKKQL